MWIAFVAVFVICLQADLLVVASEDSCDYSLCNDGVQHVACDAIRQISKKCTGQAAEIEFNPTLIDHIVALHNRRRNQVAEGLLYPFPKAVKMAEMTWDTNLTSFARFTARKCENQPVVCRNHSFPAFGQNLALIDLPYNYSSRVVITKLFQKWFNKHVDCNRDAIDKFPSNNDYREYDAFTQLIKDDSDRVGCAAMRNTSPGSRPKKLYTYLVCNYSKKNVANQPVYTVVIDKVACAECVCSKNYPGLCVK